MTYGIVQVNSVVYNFLEVRYVLSYCGSFWLCYICDDCLERQSDKCLWAFQRDGDYPHRRLFVRFPSDQVKGTEAELQQGYPKMVLP